MAIFKSRGTSRDRWDEPDRVQNNVEGWFDFMLVAYTQQHIVVPKKAPGDKVNIEVDVTAKYVEKSMAALVGRVEELEREVASLKSK